MRVFCVLMTGLLLPFGVAGGARAQGSSADSADSADASPSPGAAASSGPGEEEPDASVQASDAASTPGAVVGSTATVSRAELASEPGTTAATGERERAVEAALEGAPNNDTAASSPPASASSSASASTSTAGAARAGGPQPTVRRTWLFPRIANTLWRFPASIADMPPAGAAHLGTMTLAVTSLMWPAQPPHDVRIQDFVRENRNRRRNRAFPHIKGLPLSAGVGAFFGGVALAGWLADDPRLLEYDALMVETLAVAQIYVGLGKALIGRDAPFRDRSGRVNGPRLQIRGTPSGHTATMYSILSVTAWYWNQPWLHVLAHAVGIWFGMGLVYNQQHYVSDVLFGAAIGYYLGRWVVRHRVDRVGSRVGGAMLIPMWGDGRIGLSVAGSMR